MGMTSDSGIWRLETIPTAHLRFDPENPRFAEAELEVGRDEKAIIHYLLHHADLTELLTSIAEAGFIDLEPMIVLRSGNIVLEGNRRLAAIRVHTSAELRRTLKLDLPDLDEAKMASLEEVRVYFVERRQDARAFIGFKHVNGPHKWDAFAKATFAVNWIKDGGDIREVARTLGDNHNTVRRQVSGWFLLEQAKKNGFALDDRQRKPFFFSHLYTAFSRPGIRQWLGLPPDDRNEDPRPDPVPEDHIDHLAQLMSWLYGSRSRNEPTIIGNQNPDLNRLNDVLAHPEARAHLVEQRNLSKAFELVESPSRRFEGALVQAVQFTGEALAVADAFTGDGTLLETARRLKKMVTNLVVLMERPEE